MYQQQKDLLDSGWRPEDRESSAPRLDVMLDGFEGPIDLLLHLARDQKVDLLEISVLQLAQQYLDFIRNAQSLRLEIAADYLVMAAWLAFLKSKLLIPKPAAEGEAEGPQLASDLAFQLARLDAMRTAGRNLFARAQLGLERHVRGAPESTPVETDVTFRASLSDLLKAYARQRGRVDAQHITLNKPELYPFEAALQRLRGLVGTIPDWSVLSGFLPDDLKPGLQTRSAIANTFLATLQLVRLGALEMRQDEPFAPIELRSPEGSVLPTRQQASETLEEMPAAAAADARDTANTSTPEAEA